MPLKRQSSVLVWENYSASAGEASSEVDVSEVEFLTVYIEVSGATTITLQVYTAHGWKDRDTLSFSGSGYDFWEIWAQAWQKIRFVTSNAVTITLEVMYKT